MTSRPRIALLLPNLGIGGAEKLFVELAAHLVEAGYAVDFVTLGSECEWALPDGINWFPLRQHSDRGRPKWVRFLDMPIVVIKLCRILRDRDVDLVYSGLFRTNVLALLAKFHTRTTTVISLHSYYSKMQQGQPLKRLAARLLYPRADAAIFVSSSIRRDFEHNYTKAIRRAHVIPNFLPRPIEPCPSPVLNARQTAAGQGGHRTTIASVARLVPEKNLETLVRAVARLRDRIADLELVIVGDGPERRSLEDLTDVLNLKPVVTFVGAANLPATYLRDAQLYVQPSLHEAFGLAALEAMHLGLPMILSDIPAFRELSDGGACAVLVDPHSERDVADAIYGLLTDPARLRQLGQQGRARASAYRPEEILPKYHRIFANILGAG